MTRERAWYSAIPFCINYTKKYSHVLWSHQFDASVLPENENKIIVTFSIKASRINLKTASCYRDRHVLAKSRSTAVPTPAITFMAQYSHKQAHLRTDKEYLPWWWVYQHWESGFSHPKTYFAYICGNKVKKYISFTLLRVNITDGQKTGVCWWSGETQILPSMNQQFISAKYWSPDQHYTANFSNLYNIYLISIILQNHSRISPPPLFPLLFTSFCKWDLRFFYVCVTVHRKKFLCNKINQMHQFHKFIFVKKFYMFRTVPLSIIRSLFIVHSAMVYVIHVCRSLLSRTRMGLVPSCSCLKAVYKPVRHIPLLSV